MLKNLIRISALLSLSTLLTACLPPTFYSIVNIYAVEDSPSPDGDVTFEVNVGNAPTSVNCFGGSVVLTLKSGDTYEGTATQPTNLTPGSTLR